MSMAWSSCASTEARVLTPPQSINETEPYRHVVTGLLEIPEAPNGRGEQFISMGAQLSFSVVDDVAPFSDGLAV